LTLVNSAPGGIFSGSAAVEVLPAPQISSVI